MTMTDPSAGSAATEVKDGRIVAIAGPVVDVEFPRGHLPEINTAIFLYLELKPITLNIT